MEEVVSPFVFDSVVVVVTSFSGVVVVVEEEVELVEVVGVVVDVVVEAKLNLNEEEGVSS